MRCIYNPNPVIHVSHTPVGALVEIVQWGHNQHYQGYRMLRDSLGLLPRDYRWSSTFRLWDNTDLNTIFKLSRHSNLLVRVIE